MVIVTWNVLHRIHAENWAEQVPARFPDEGIRLRAVATRVVDLVTAAIEARDAVVVCLQEVSGDQLDVLKVALRAAVPDGALHTLRYPRVPTLKAEGPAPLKEPDEYLVTIVAGGTPFVGGVVRSGSAFDNDPGKGFLVVDIGAEAGGVVVLNTHLSAKERRGPQLARLAAIVEEHGVTVVCGDCNTDAATVVAGLGGGFSPVELGRDALPTRPRADGSSDKPPAIDHIFVRGGVGSDGAVVDVGGTSDHNLVRARVTPRA